MWYVVCGLWYVVCGMWCVVRGMWYLVCGYVCICIWVCDTYHIPHTTRYGDMPTLFDHESGNMPTLFDHTKEAIPLYDGYSVFAFCCWLFLLLLLGI